MSYVFGATLALAGIIERRRESCWQSDSCRLRRGPLSLCPPCGFAYIQFNRWLQRERAHQRADVEVLWGTSMPLAQAFVVVKRHAELGGSHKVHGEDKT